MINWNELTKEDVQKISKIVTRAMKLMSVPKSQRMNLDMDISAAHLDCPMDLDKLIAFDDTNFIHDVGGICMNINRGTGKLDNCFLPRCARPEIVGPEDKH